MVTHNIEMVSPEIARIILCNQIFGQRPLKPKHVKKLTREMLQGRWRFNGDPIRLDKNGLLMDGQHRLTAIIETGLSFEFLIVRGLEPNVMPTIDTDGKARSGGDVLRNRGEKSVDLLSAAATFGINLSRGINSFSATVSKQEIIGFIDNHPKIRDSVDFINGRKWLKVLLRPSVSVVLHYSFSNINSELADSFFHTLNTGETSLGKINAASVLRETLMEKKVVNKKANVGFNRHYEPAITIKAWNAYIKGDVPKRYSYDPKREKGFPKISNKILVNN